MVKNLLNDYVYKNLNKYGNTVIGYSDLKRYGKDKILDDLKQHNFNCNIRIIGHDVEKVLYPNWHINELTIIVEAIKDE